MPVISNDESPLFKALTVTLRSRAVCRLDGSWLEADVQSSSLSMKKKFVTAFFAPRSRRGIAIKISLKPLFRMGMSNIVKMLKGSAKNTSERIFGEIYVASCFHK